MLRPTAWWAKEGKTNGTVHSLFSYGAYAMRITAQPCRSYNGV